MAGKLLIVVIAVVVGVLVGVAVYVAVSANDNEPIGNDDGGNPDAKYWFYIDYREHASSTVKNGWYSSNDGATASEGLVKALDAKKISHNIDGIWIYSINGVEPIYEVSQTSWFTWPWIEAESKWQMTENLGLGEPGMTIFYVSISSFDADNEYLPFFDPNTETGWKNKGPFATA